MQSKNGLDKHMKAKQRSHTCHTPVGKKIKYRYENGWEYHAYYESEKRIAYEVVSGPFGSEESLPDHAEQGSGAKCVYGRMVRGDGHHRGPGGKSEQHGSNQFRRVPQMGL